jgi:serine O-acetyltransferase
MTPQESYRDGLSAKVALRARGRRSQAPSVSSETPSAGSRTITVTDDARGRSATIGPVMGEQPGAAPLRDPLLNRLKQRLNRLWVFSPERLWLLSIRLQRAGHWRAAFCVKQLNTFAYHNSLGAGATVSPDVKLGHYSHGIVINSAVVIGRNVRIWHDVTLHARRARRGREATADVPSGEIVIEDNVVIGNRAVVMSPRGRRLRIGRGARIGPGTVVTQDVAAGERVVAPPAHVLPPDGHSATRPMPRPDEGDVQEADELPDEAVS